jgi:putative membrane protein
MKRLAAVAATSALAMALAAGATVAQGQDSHDASGGVQHSTSDHRVCGLDEQWLKNSIEGDRFEIQGGQLALSKSSAPKVRKLAQTLIDDHTKSLNDAIDLAHRYGIAVPDSPSPVQQWILADLAKKSGKEFDQAYSSAEVADHVQDIDEAQEEAEDGCNQDIRDDAKKEIPTLQYHLQLAKEALASVTP